MKMIKEGDYIIKKWGYDISITRTSECSWINLDKLDGYEIKKYIMKKMIENDILSPYFLLIDRFYLNKNSESILFEGFSFTEYLIDAIFLFPRLFSKKDKLTIAIDNSIDFNLESSREIEKQKEDKNDK